MQAACRGWKECRVFAVATRFLSLIAGVAMAALFLFLSFPVASDTKPATRTLASASPAFTAYEEAAIKRRAKARVDRLIRLAQDREKKKSGGSSQQKSVAPKKAAPKKAAPKKAAPKKAAPKKAALLRKPHRRRLHPKRPRLHKRKPHPRPRRRPLLRPQRSRPRPRRKT